MCGRFVSASSPDEIAQYFDVVDTSDQVLEPNFNVAPTADVSVVVEQESRRRLDAFHWGLVPRWAKDPSVGSRMINARSEGVAEKGAFKWAFRKRRCLVPADGFYEWKKVSGQKVKQPYYIARRDGELLALAGLWEEWRGPDRDGSQIMRSVTILTTVANETVSTLHDRMPVILAPPVWNRWLDRSDEDVGSLANLLVAAPASLLTMRPVSTEVNNARTTGSHLLDPFEPSALGSGSEDRAARQPANVQGTLL